MPDVVRCPNCDLNQFNTQSGNCRKCHSALNTPPAPEKPVIYMQPAPLQLNNLFSRFGLACKLIRISKNLSQRKLAIRMGTNRSSINKIERGKFKYRGILWTSMTKLFYALEVSPSQFFLLMDALNG